jgi:hypothetical protein
MQLRKRLSEVRDSSLRIVPEFVRNFQLGKKWRGLRKAPVMADPSCRMIRSLPLAVQTRVPGIDTDDSCEVARVEMID